MSSLKIGDKRAASDGKIFTVTGFDDGFIQGTWNAGQSSRIWNHSPGFIRDSTSPFDEPSRDALLTRIATLEHKVAEYEQQKRFDEVLRERLKARINSFRDLAQQLNDL